MTNGSSRLSVTVFAFDDCAASAAEKSRPTRSVGGQFSSSSSFCRLASSVTMNFAWLPPGAVTRPAIAAGPKAVNSG